jgi:hypothetical protein
VKRAPAGSGRAPVASGTGAEAPAAAGCVGATPVASGGFGGVVLGLRVGAGGEVVGHGLCLGGGAWRRRRSHGDGVTAAWLHMRALE